MTSEQMPERTPCPFCGVAPPPPTDATKIEGVWVMVHRCPHVGPLTVKGPSSLAVLERWNSRTIDADLVKQAKREVLDKAQRVINALPITFHGAADTYRHDKAVIDMVRAAAGDVFDFMRKELARE